MMVPMAQYHLEKRHVKAFHFTGYSTVHLLVKTNNHENIVLFKQNTKRAIYEYAWVCAQEIGSTLSERCFIWQPL